MIDLHSIQTDLLYAPILIVVTLVIRLLITRFGWMVEERIVAQLLTFLIILLTKVLGRSIRKNPMAQGHAFSIRQELTLLQSKLKPPKIRLG